MIATATIMSPLLTPIQTRLYSDAVATAVANANVPPDGYASPIRNIRIDYENGAADLNKRKGVMFSTPSSHCGSPIKKAVRMNPPETIRTTSKRVDGLSFNPIRSSGSLTSSPASVLHPDPIIIPPTNKTSSSAFTANKEKAPPPKSKANKRAVPTKSKQKNKGINNKKFIESCWGNPEKASNIRHE